MGENLLGRVTDRVKETLPQRLMPVVMALALVAGANAGAATLAGNPASLGGQDAFNITNTPAALALSLTVPPGHREPVMLSSLYMDVSSDSPAANAQTYLDGTQLYVALVSSINKLPKGNKLKMAPMDVVEAVPLTDGTGAPVLDLAGVQVWRIRCVLPEGENTVKPNRFEPSAAVVTGISAGGYSIYLMNNPGNGYTGDKVRDGHKWAPVPVFGITNFSATAEKSSSSPLDMSWNGGSRFRYVEKANASHVNDAVKRSGIMNTRNASTRRLRGARRV